MSYQHILVAVDLSNDADLIVEKAKTLASFYSASLMFVHVMEPVIQDSAYEMTPVLPVELQETLKQRAESFLKGLLQKHDLTATEYCLELGSIKTRLFQVVQDNNIDLIILGTHGRHGFGLLMGSTANAVLHGTPCDVLAVKIPENV